MSESGREIRQGLGRNEEENKEVDKKHVQEGKRRGKDETKDVREVKETHGRNGGKNRLDLQTEYLLLLILKQHIKCL